jgi:predicted metal-binding protein
MSPETISIKRKDLEAWLELVELFGCDGCSGRGNCRECGMTSTKRLMRKYLKRQEVLNA